MRWCRAILLQRASICTLVKNDSGSLVAEVTTARVLIFAAMIVGFQKMADYQNRQQRPFLYSAANDKLWLLRYSELSIDDCVQLFRVS